jgi:hypothetical protein
MNNVFISYSHADTKWLQRLQVHLKPLERHGTITRWDDTLIAAGTRWREEIQEALARAKVAILLVSADFLASDFIANNELPPLLLAAEQRGTLILPVIISPCRFVQTEALSCFQAVNNPVRPLAGLRPARREAVFLEVTQRIEEALTKSEKGLASAADITRPIQVEGMGQSHSNLKSLSEYVKLFASPADEMQPWSEDDVLTYVALRVLEVSSRIATGIGVSLNSLYRSAVDSEHRLRLYELVHGCMRNGWLKSTGFDQEQKVTFTPAGVIYFKSELLH